MKDKKIEWTIDNDKTWGRCLWISDDCLMHFKENGGMNWNFCGRPYDGLVLGFGKNTFVYSLDASPILETNK